jgi:hypothetical protein
MAMGTDGERDEPDDGNATVHALERARRRRRRREGTSPTRGLAVGAAAGPRCYSANNSNGAKNDDRHLHRAQARTPSRSPSPTLAASRFARHRHRHRHAGRHRAWTVNSHDGERVDDRRHAELQQRRAATSSAIVSCSSAPRRGCVTGGGTIATNGQFTAGHHRLAARTRSRRPQVAARASATLTVVGSGALRPSRRPRARRRRSVTGTTTVLSVRATDDAGEAGTPPTRGRPASRPRTVTFTQNSSNAAKDTTATFTQAGDLRVPRHGHSTPRATW